MAIRQLIRRFQKAPAAPPSGEVAGANVGAHLAPYIGELPLDPQLPARDAYHHTDETDALRLYRQTLRDERCAAALEQRLNAAISTPWEVEPGGDMRRDRLAAEHLAEQIEGLKFARICRQLLHGVWYGWAVGEAMWGRDSRRVVIDNLAVRSPDRFWWSSEGELLLRTWQIPQGEPVPPGKFVLLARPGEHDDLPWAPGLARWCFWPVWMKRHGLKFWSVALEKFGAPTAVGKYPKGADVQEKRRLLQIINSLATGAGVAIPEDQVIELLATAQRTGGSGGIDFSSFVDYLDRCITTTILGQSSTTDQGPWRGTAEVQKDVRDETIAADARLLDETLNDTIARWLTAWNFPGAAIPSIRHDADPPEDLDARAKREKTISETTGLRPTESHIVDVYGGEWEERPQPASEDPPDGEPAEPGPADDAELAGATDPPGGAAGEAPDAGGEEDVGDLLRQQLRRTVGPSLDRWVDTVREQLDNADSLGGVRARLDTVELDLEVASRALRDGLAAAVLAGRFDADAPVDVEETEFAASDPETLAHARLPFAEQIAFFRDKLNLPTAAWTDIFNAQHDVSFVVAGAMRDALLEDLRAAVDSAIAEGTTLETFRKDFDTLVAKHGWDYKGGRDWRTRVIYDTNVRQSYAAGRWQQLQAVKTRRPYWRYRHSHASENPREQHLQWDGLVLPADDPWFDTHAPMNGWGCKCYIEALSERDLERLGKSGPDTAPPIEMRTVTVDGGARTVRVPKGIDPGFGYAPGASRE